MARRRGSGIRPAIALICAATALLAAGFSLLSFATGNPSHQADGRAPTRPVPTTSRATPIVISRGGSPEMAPTAELAPSAPALLPAPPQAPLEGAAISKTPPERDPAEPDRVVEDSPVAAALRALRTDQDRVGQLLMLGWVGQAEDARSMIETLRPGGIVQIANARTAQDAARVNTGLVAIARQSGLLTPLLAVDHEGGRVQRIQDVPNSGSNWQFGLRDPDDRAACERGRTHAAQLATMGFSMNLAPVLDVNNNPNNPVIGDRSYGADPNLVARLGSAYVRGLQAGGVAAVGKHFPGHGNTSVDSHLSLPILRRTLDELEAIELVPFRRVVQPDVRIAAIMSAHIVFPAVDPSRQPATLSHAIMTGLLRQRLGFDGLVLSDDLGAMRAITDNFAPGEAAVQAVRAGVDMLIIAGPLDRQRASRDALVAAVRDGTLSRERLDDAVRHVIELKARFGLVGSAEPAAGQCE